jgi:hypothetical protein
LEEKVAGPFNETHPSSNDLHEILLAILRLQDVYQLDSEDLASGIIAGSRVRNLMTALDFRNLGVVAIQKGMFEWAWQWLALAVESSDDEHLLENVAKLLPLAEVGYKVVQPLIPS